MGKLFNLLKQTFKEWNEDKAPRLAAALAYYTVFSLAPFLVIIIAIVGLWFGQSAAQKQIMDQITGLVGSNGAQAIEAMIAGASRPRSSILATIIAIALLLFGAGGLFGQLHDALNTIWEITPKPGRNIFRLIRERFLSFVMVLGVAFLMLVSLVLSAGLTAVGTYMKGLFPGFTALMQGVSFLFSFIVITLLFALLYKFLPEAEIAWRDVWLGAAVTALLFSIGKFFIELYVQNGNFTVTYGIAASLIIILLWAYYMGQILLFGAEFTQVYANTYGSHIRVESDAMPTSEVVRGDQGIPHGEKVIEAAQRDVRQGPKKGGRVVAPIGEAPQREGDQPPMTSAVLPATGTPGQDKPIVYNNIEQEPKRFSTRADKSLKALQAILISLVGFVSGLALWKSRS
jgi:membrane protein